VVEKIAHRDLRGRIGLVKPEAGVEIGDARIPADDTLAHEGGHHGRGDGLGQGGDLKHRLRPDQVGLSDLPVAEAFQEEGLVAVDNRDRETRHVARIDGLLRQRFERRQTRLDLRTGDGLAERASGTARDDAERDTDRRDAPMGSKPLHLIVDPIKDGSGKENRAEAAPKLIAATIADKPKSVAPLEGGSN
jgi:hypothetical protein